MSSVESRVMTMKFDNKQFGPAVTDTLSMFQKLKMAMSGMPSKLSMGKLDGSGAGAALDTIKTHIDGVHAGFLALGTVAVTALANITNRAVDAGIKLGKAFTIDPLVAGFHEYELKLGSIQTILANTQKYGTTLPQVNAALNQLNHYADKTIYDFGAMTKNIGLFTNAGIRIKPAVSMIKGFSNVAAASGTNAEGAASAAYQLSQALSAGTIRLMDWKSLTNVGMGNQNMRDGLLSIGEAMGTLQKTGTNANDVQQNFNSTLEKGWLSADVMSKYLRIMAGDMSNAEMKALGLSDAQIKTFNLQQKTAEAAATKVRTFTQLIGTVKESIGSVWSAVFEILIGDFNEATKLWTNVNNVVGGAVQSMGNSLIKLLKGWDKLGGRSALIKGLGNVFTALGHVMKPIGQAFRDMFPPATAKGLYDLTKGFERFTKSLIPGKKTMADIRTIFDAVFGVLKIGIQIIGGIIHYIASFFGLLSGGTGGVLHFIASIAGVIKAFEDWIIKSDIIKKFFDHIIATRQAVFGPIVGLIGKIAGALGDLINNGLQRFLDFLDKIQPQIDKVKNAIQAFASALGDKIGAFFDKLKPYASDVGQLASSFASLAASKIADFFSYLADHLDNIGSLLSKLGPMFSSIGGAIKKAFGALSGAAGNISLGGMFDIGGQTSVAAAGVNKVSGAMNKLGGTGNVVSHIWDAVVNAFKIVGKVIAGAGILIVKAFGKVKDGIANFFHGMSTDDTLAVINTAFLTATYIAIHSFFKKLGGLAGAASKTIGQIGGTFDQLTSNLKTMQNEVRAKMILEIAAALFLLAAALWILSKIPADKIAISLGAVAGLMVILVTALKMLNGKMGVMSAINMAAMSVGMIALAIAVTLFAGAIALLGRMKTSTLVKGIAAIAAVMAVLITSMKLMDASGGAVEILAAAAALLILSAALVALAGAIKLYDSMDMSTIGDGMLKIAITLVALGFGMSMMPPNMLATAAGLVIVAVALTMIAGAMKIFGSMSVGEMAKSLIMLAASLLILSIAVNSMDGALPGAAALFVVAAALDMLVPALVALGNMSWGEILKSMVALAAALLIISVAAAIITATGAVLAIAALGVALVILGAGFALVGAGMLMFATGLAILAVSGTAGLAALQAAIISMAELLPLIAHQFGLALIALAKVIAKSGPPMIRAFTTIIKSLAKAAIKASPVVNRAFVKVMKDMLKSARKLSPDFNKTGWKLLMDFLKGVKKNIGDLVDIGSDIIVRFLKGVSRNLNKILKAGTNLIIKFINGMQKNSNKIIDAGMTAVIKFMNGVARSIDKHAPEMRAAGGRIGAAIIRGLFGGLAGAAQSVYNKAQEIAGKVMSILKHVPLIGSPSRVTTYFGEMIGRGLADGLDNSAHLSSRSAENMANSALDVMRVTMSKMADAIDDGVDLSPTVTPILDLTQLVNDANAIGALLDGKSVSGRVSLDQANAISADRLAAAVAALQNGSDSSESKGDTFVQNNYSPEPLSPVRIYRQTRNQLNLARRRNNA